MIEPIRVAPHHPGTVKTVTIDRMTMDLFQYWLENDWRTIGAIMHSSNWYIPPLYNAGKGTGANEQYHRIYAAHWDESEKIEDSATVIAWAQIRTETVRVEFTINNRVTENLSQWLAQRFGVDVTEAAPTISNAPPPKLTPTETKVAGLLAEGMDYAQIGIRLGDKTEHAAKKHAQALARKWGTKGIIERLWSEARLRGYGSEK